MLGTLLTLIVVAAVARSIWRRRSESLPRVLASATAAGIVTAEQRERLLAHAAEHSGGRRLGATWLAIVAGLFIVAGVSLLVARNWELIGPAVRIAAFLVALLVAGEAAIRTRARTLALSLPLELVWFVLPLLGIGLYGQTFQLSGDAVRPALVWLALTAPLAWSSVRSVVPVLHTLALGVVLFLGNFVVGPMDWLLGTAPGTGGTLALFGTPTLAAWILSLALLATIAVQSLSILPRHHRHHFLGVCAVWLFVVLAVCKPVRLEDPVWLMLAAASLATTWVGLHARLDTSIAEWRTSVTAWLATLYGLTFLWHVPSTPNGEAAPGGVAVTVLAVVAAVGVVGTLPPSRLSPSAAWARAAKTALLLPLAATALLFSDEVQVWWTVAVLMNLLLVVVAVGLMWHGALARETAQINLGVMVLVGILVTRFLDVFGGMLRSGVGRARLPALRRPDAGAGHDRGSGGDPAHPDASRAIARAGRGGAEPRPARRRGLDTERLAHLPVRPRLLEAGLSVRMGAAGGRCYGALCPVVGSGVMRPAGAGASAGACCVG